jgi:hypothetical protein
MPNLLERAVDSVSHRLVLVAPPDVAIPDAFDNVEFKGDDHGSLIRAVQQFRGRIYVSDGAIDAKDLAPGGLHRTPEDDQSWHLLALDEDGQIAACAWYKYHSNDVYFSRLRLRHCPLASSPEWRDTLWRAVEDDIRLARRVGIGYSELGGWAVDQRHRCTSAGLLLGFAIYALGRLLGGAFGVTTATERHGSANILCRLGGAPLAMAGTVIPPYYDARYGCTMEIVRFDSRSPSPRYDGLIRRLERRLADVAVVARPYWPNTRSQSTFRMPAFVPPAHAVAAYASSGAN